MLKEVRAVEEPLLDEGCGPETRMKCLSSRIYISTLPFGWLPDHGIQFFSLFLRDLKHKWSALFSMAEEHLARTVSIHALVPLYIGKPA